MVDITFFCSPIGLGHATRDAAVGDRFKDSINFVTGSGAAKLLSSYGFKVENVYDPPQFIVNNGRLEKSLRWLWRYYQYYKECKEVAEKIIENDPPKMVVSDEDFASLTISQNKRIPSILVTDILETDFTDGIGSIIERKMNRSMAKIIEKCDLVIMPEEGEDEQNIKRVGPIVRQISSSRESIRERFGFHKKTILVSVGGTSAGEFLIDKIVEVLPKISSYADVVFVTGPQLKKNLTRVRNLGFVDNLHEYIFASDLVVSLAGKSTIDEARAYGTPGVFIPIKGHFEQEDNARAQGYKFEDVFRLSSIVEQKLDEKRNPINSNGVTRAQELIKSLL